MVPTSYSCHEVTMKLIEITYNCAGYILSTMVLAKGFIFIGSEKGESFRRSIMSLRLLPSHGL